MKKRILGIAIIVMLVVSMIPVSVSAVSTLSSVNLTYNMDDIKLNTAFTEGEVNSRVTNLIGTTTTGVIVDSNNNDLMYKAASWNAIGNGENQVNAEKNYGFKYTLEPAQNYEWDASIKSATSYTLLSEIDTTFKVSVNGIDRNDVYIVYDEYWDNLKVIVPIGNPDTSPIITRIFINEPNTSVQRGTSLQFTCTIEGTANDKTGTWSVVGNNSGGTFISAGGLLTVAANESAEEINVVITSNFDNTESSSILVTLIDEEATIDKVVLDPKPQSLYVGDAKQFYATVTGLQDDKRVSWFVIGAQSVNTTISNDGLLRIDDFETADVIKVKAESTFDNSKFDSIDIQILKKTTLKKIDVTFDANAINLSPEFTEGQVEARLKQHVSVTSDGCGISDSDLMYKYESFNGIGSGLNKVSSSKEYYIRISIELDEGFSWVPEVTDLDYTLITEWGDYLKITVNGKKNNEIYLDYNSYWRNLYIYAPICCGNHIFNVETHPASLSADGWIMKTCDKCGWVDSENIPRIASVLLKTKSYVYSGEYKKPTATVKDSAENIIPSTNYSISYSNNKYVGTAKATIKFKNLYSGSKTLTFKIVPKSTAISSLTKAKKAFTVKWKKQATQTTGYQIQYSRSSTFASGNKLVTVSSNKTLSKKISKLSAKKKYYVRVRTYKSVSGTKYYSSWSAKKYVTTK